MCRLLLIWTLLAVIYGDLLSFQASTNGDSYYGRGLALKKKGEKRKALQTWLTGSQQLQREGKSNPNIGFAFMELATELGLRQTYSVACQIYLWGLSTTDSLEHGEAIGEEVERIAPLLEDDQHKEWKRLLQNNHNLLVEQIKNFWQERDPTPSTQVNERLLEHWQRIAHARKNYTLANTNVYGTDDRGVIYVKYGKPDRIRRGFLGTNRAKMKRWSGVIRDLQTSADQGSAQGAVAGGTMAGAIETLMLETIDRYNYSPEYEVWLYQQEGASHPVFFLFGNREGLGSFGLRDGVEDFIPRSAFMQSSTTYTGGIVPGAVLQALYYSELAFIHPDFEDRYYELESRWDNLDRDGPSAIVSFNSSIRGKRRLYEGIDQVFAASDYMPPDESNFEEMVSSVDLVLHPFRFLARDRGAMMALTAFSFPKIKGRFLNTRSPDLVPKYSIAHTLVVHDKHKKELQRQQAFLPNQAGNLSTFILPHERDQSEYEVITEIFAPETTRPDLSDSTLAGDQQAIGLGRAYVPPKVPLSSAPDRLELSDLIIGVEIPSQAQTANLPFPIVPSTRIRAGDLMKIYLEVYHLNLDPEGMAHFTIDFEAAKLKGKKKSKKETISLSFNFDSPTSTSKESFQVDTAKLPPGNYQLLLTVKDTVSGQSKERKEVFQIE